MYGFECSLTVLVPGETPCLECLYPVRDRGWEPLGFPVLGAVSGIIGCMAAMEAVKWITGVGEPCTNRMYRLNTLDLQGFSVSLSGVEPCPACRGGKRS